MDKNSFPFLGVAIDVFDGGLAIGARSTSLPTVISICWYNGFTKILGHSWFTITLTSKANYMLINTPVNESVSMIRAIAL
ncbi:hypothetical protein MP228_012894 [Amoeboaphelidium protococcarum]|nr:hypothetical protein MP228_012894 [Amoeboaphelidium protococcarum]